MEQLLVFYLRLKWDKVLVQCLAESEWCLEKKESLGWAVGETLWRRHIARLVGHRHERLGGLSGHFSVLRPKAVVTRTMIEHSDASQWCASTQSPCGWTACFRLQVDLFGALWHCQLKSLCLGFFDWTCGIIIILIFQRKKWKVS